MRDSEKVRCLLRGLWPDTMERVAISTPKMPAEFLQQSRLTHVGATAQHAMGVMPTQPLPGFAAASPFLPDTRNGTRGTTFVHNWKMPSGHEESASPVVTTEMFNALQESVKVLTTAVEQLTRPAPRGLPARQSQDQARKVLCYQYGRLGHIMQQCKTPLGPTVDEGVQPSGNWQGGVLEFPPIQKKNYAGEASYACHLTNVPVSVGNHETTMIVDTGLSVNIASQRFVHSIGAKVNKTTIMARNVNGKLVSAAGEVTLDMRIGLVVLRQAFLVLGTLPYN